MKHMISGWSLGWLSWCLVVGGLWAAEPKPAPGPGRGVALKLVELRGRVVCLAEAMHDSFAAELPTRHEHAYGFKTAEGKYYSLLRTKYSEALFSDEIVRSKDLVLKGRIFPKTQIFEPVTLRALRDGKVFDLVYYCDICDIYTVAPGICECCQGPTKLMEKPVERK